jgi:UDP-N-acetylglucosamine 2-epimerase (non-hydrolysing)
MPLLDNYCDHKIIHTGQNYDYELNEVFFKDLELRKPDYFLNVDTSSLGTVIGETISKTENVLVVEKPDAVLILGDTNSSTACIIAKRLKIPIYHMEAGNRSFDPNVPEEINRKIIDHIADYNLVYSEHARRNLINEGLPAGRIYLSGSPMKEILEKHHKRISESAILQTLNLTPKGYYLVSTHREENVDNVEHLLQILDLLNNLACEENIPIIVSTHPRTRKRIENIGDQKVNKQIQFLKPFGFFDYIFLQQNARCVISDSGTISEESAILNFPAVTIRNSMERPEAIDAGTITLCGLDAETVKRCIRLATDKFNREISVQIPHEYGFSDVSYRVVQLILGTAGLSNKMSGVVSNSTK